MANDLLKTISNRTRIFRLLVLYRWFSLLPPIIFVILSLSANEAGSNRQTLFVLGTAVMLNIIITAFFPQLNRTLKKQPALLFIDLLLVATFILFSGGWQSPYYLYALNPLLAAAFFFQLRGALIAATIFAPLYAISITINGATIDWLAVVGNISGFYLISGTFGYAAMLLAQLQATGRDLQTAHQELKVLHQLTASLHQAADVESVQEMVFMAVTQELGCAGALVGLVDESEQHITGWLGGHKVDDQTAFTNISHSTRLPLNGREDSLIVKAMQTRQLVKITPTNISSDPWFNEEICRRDCIIVPLCWGVQRVGLLLVTLTSTQAIDTLRPSLEAIARQTAVALSMMMARQRRAKETAVQEERARIAMDLHDSVSQSLFGVALTLTGSLGLLPEQPETAVPELRQALATTEMVRREIRHTIHDIWTEEISAAAFQADLQKYISDVLQAHNLTVHFDIRGDFGALSARAQRSLYRISQEALTNIVHHAHADEARVCVDVANHRATLSIRDNGRGFEPAVALTQERSHEHFGLRGMYERARSLGGSCDIFSQPGAGTSIVIDVPAFQNEQQVIST